MKKYLLKVDDISYLILIREIVCQLKDKHRIIFSGSINPSISRLDFKLFPKTIQNKYSLSQINTNSKVNINYITNKVLNADNKQEINQKLFDVLLNTKYTTDNQGIEYLEFKNEDDLSLFLVFKKFKSVNAGFFDIASRTIKKTLKAYEQVDGYEKIPYNKDFNNELGPRSLILITPEGDVIYSNRVFINFDDFFTYNDNETRLKEIDEVKTCILKKLSQNKVYKYSKNKDDNIFKELKYEIDLEIEKNYFVFQKMIRQL